MIRKYFSPGTVAILGGVPDGYEACALAALAADAGAAGLLYIARDAERMESVRQGLRFFAPDLAVRVFPAWDCTPYDRVSPGSAVLGQRMETLAFLDAVPGAGPRVLLTSVAAAGQRTPPRSAIAEAGLVVRPGDTVDFGALPGLLARIGYVRVGTVREAGEMAVRGGLLDVFPQAPPSRCGWTCSATVSNRCAPSIR